MSRVFRSFIMVALVGIFAFGFVAGCSSNNEEAMTSDSSMSTMDTMSDDQPSMWGEKTKANIMMDEEAPVNMN